MQTSAHVSRARLGCSMTLILSLIVLGACSQEGGGNDGADASDEAGASTEEDGGSAAGDSLESHEDLVAAAEEESGTLNVSGSDDQEVGEQFVASFEEKYPFIDAQYTELSGSDADRIILELESGQNDFDVLYQTGNRLNEYEGHNEPVNFPELIDKGVVDIPDGMVDPDTGNRVAVGSAIGAFVAYNPDLVAEEDVPETYDDLLTDRWADQAMLVDIEPDNMVTLWDAWGEERLLDYTEELAAQNPQWIRGNTKGLTQIVAEESELFAFPNYHSAYRLQQEGDDVPLETVLAEPVGVRVGEVYGPREGTPRLHQTLLYIEHLASEEGQELYDEAGPAQASIYTEGSIVNQATEGLETSLIDWDDYAELQGRVEAVRGAAGMPTEEELGVEDD